MEPTGPMEEIPITSTNEKLQPWRPCDTATVHSWLMQWLTMCLGQRRTSTTRAITANDTDGPKEDENWAPLLEEKRPSLPSHAATSFLKTGTSRIIREANNIL